MIDHFTFFWKFFAISRYTSFDQLAVLKLHSEKLAQSKQLVWTCTLARRPLWEQTGFHHLSLSTHHSFSFWESFSPRPVQLSTSLPSVSSHLRSPHTTLIYPLPHFLHGRKTAWARLLIQISSAARRPVSSLSSHWSLKWLWGALSQFYMQIELHLASGAGLLRAYLCKSDWVRAYCHDAHRPCRPRVIFHPCHSHHVLREK